MYKAPFTSIISGLFSEIVFGSPDPVSPTYLLNRGDPGLLASIESLSADAASASSSGGKSIAAHVDHLRYDFSLFNRWVSGEPDPSKTADWTQSWKKARVTGGEWRALRDDLRREVERWRETLREERELPEPVVMWMVASVPHTSYHLGAIRQIDRATRGPTAEDVRREDERAKLRGNV